MASKRIFADTVEIQKPLYAESGIYYSPNDADVTKGFACVFGPAGTPYEDCPMIYEIELPSTFPFDPPSVQFRTYDGKTRFHPNMYINGKVCLSILHTWSGPRWASTMRLSTVLVTLQGLMDSAPLRHEPGFETGRDKLSESYAKAVEVSCMKYIIERAAALLAGKDSPDAFVPFEEIFRERLPKTLERLIVRLQERLGASGEHAFVGLPYQMEGRSDYRVLLEKTEGLINNYRYSVSGSGSSPATSDKIDDGQKA